MKPILSAGRSNPRGGALPRKRSHRRFLVAAAVLLPLVTGAPAAGQAPQARGPQTQVIDLTLEQMVDLTLSRSYRVRRLNLDVQRDQYNLRAERARLKSSVDMDLTIPAFRLTSEPKWNSELQRDEIIQENTRRWEGELSVRQPVMVFGYPTNGYLSFNNRMYRYTQINDDGNSEVDYYNRYYLSYTQPLFQPNGLKNNLEQAEMSLERTRLGFYGDVVDIVDNVSESYYDLFEEHIRRDMALGLVEDLERALAIAQDLGQAAPSRSNDVDQIQVELANARERVQSAESSIRLESASVKRSLGLADTDSIAFVPVFNLDPVTIDMDQAIQYAMELTPRMRQLDLSYRNSEIDLEETRSQGAFRLNLNMSYGRERLDDEIDKLWVNPDNSYTLNVNAYLPVWDSGRRKARIASSEIRIQQTLLSMEEAELQIVSGVRNEVLNVRDRESRTMAMRQNLELAQGVSETSFQRFQAGAITAPDLILNLRREADTAGNFLDAYLGWRGSLRQVQAMTYFDFEHGTPVLERFGVEDRLPGNEMFGLPTTPTAGTLDPQRSLERGGRSD